jgi:hypothetical protein
MIPELDYAFIAEHAQVASGKLNVMGASYTHLIVDDLPSLHTVAVAGRVRARKDFGPVEVALIFSSPAGETQYSIEGAIDIESSEDVRPYGDLVGLLFASTLTAVLPVEGLYEVRLKVEGVEARRLAFTVESATAATR